MSDMIIEVIRGVMVGASDNYTGSFNVHIGYRHEGWKLHLNAGDARDLRELLDEVIAAGDEHVRLQREASETTKGGTAG